MPESPLINATPGLRLYYADSATTEFAAVVTQHTFVDGQPAVVLDATCFYPTSGGQPHDTGLIEQVAVTDVQVRAEDEAVLHILAAPLPAGTVRVHARIDRARRFDHMQQHTGQHILSQAFVRLFAADTVGFHLGNDACTIDLDLEQIASADAQRAERLANQVVWDNRPVTQAWIARADVAAYPLRKLPDVTGDRLRIVTIADFDVNACGGTHVAATGAVGLIKITRIERIRRQVRVEFRCGERAVQDYEAQRAIVQQVANQLTCAPGDLPAIIDNLRSELRQSGKALKQAQQQLLTLQAERLRAAAPQVDGVALIATTLTDYSAGDLRQLANLLTRDGAAVALLGLRGTPGHLIFARSPQVAGDMGRLLQQALTELGGSGGGAPHFAQGGGIAADPAALEQTVMAARDRWRAEWMRT